MSRGLTIVQPIPIAALAVNHGDGIDYLRSPDPKEVWQASTTAPTVIDVDLGTERQIDTVFLGFTNAAAGAVWVIRRTSNMAGADVVPMTSTGPFRVPGASGARHHGLALVPVQHTTRYLRITVVQEVGGPLLQAGVLMIGKRFEHPYEYKAGRRPIDLSERVDLAGGGFGFGRGAIKSSFRFTFADLDQAKLDQLWRIVATSGNQHPVLLVEGGDGAIAHDQVHYGVFERFEAYEREDPVDTRWGLSMQDWT